MLIDENITTFATLVLVFVCFVGCFSFSSRLLKKTFPLKVGMALDALVCVLGTDGLCSTCPMCALQFCGQFCVTIQEIV
jgi:hypothetical protein